MIITCNHILNSSSITKENDIKFSFDNEKKFYSLLRSNSRRCFSDEENDFTIIEIKENDFKDKKIEYLNIDNWIKFSLDIYRNKTVYIIYFGNGGAKFSLGKIKRIAIYNDNIIHSCFTKEGPPGVPIINLLTFSVIGIHKGGNSRSNGINSGLLMRVLIDKFNDKYKKDKNNFYIFKNELEEENNENNSNISKNDVKK